MVKKSKTQMTKAELIELCYEYESVIKGLKDAVTNLENDRIGLDTIVADNDTSFLISGMNARIKKLEDKILELGQSERKEYE
ncbi:hypothetical protein OAQ62_01270 [bacterium]|jgi:hypothetical protein|nr:hypothetical protein [bacterium]